MADFTLAQAQTYLAAAVAAQQTVLTTGQEVELQTGDGRRKFKAADLAQIQAVIQYWRSEIADLQAIAEGESAAAPALVTFA